MKTAIESLKYTAQDHSSNIKEDKRKSYSTIKSVRKFENQLEVEEEDILEDSDSDEFRCMKGKDIFLKKDALNEYLEDGQNMCSLCTISAMATNSGLVRPDMDCIAPAGGRIGYFQITECLVIDLLLESY